MSILEGGKLRCLHRGEIEHFCPGCNAVHTIDIHAQSRDGKVIGWNADSLFPSFGEPVRHETPQGECEYVLRDGVLYFLESCWHALAGQSRHLPEFPR